MQAQKLKLYKILLIYTIIYAFYIRKKTNRFGDPYGQGINTPAQ